MKHTPGPWSWGDKDRAAYLLAGEDGANRGYNVVLSVNWVGEADARLIAAAPELLSILQQLTQWDKGCTTPRIRQDFMQAIEVAIAKAGGGDTG